MKINITEPLLNEIANRVATATRHIVREVTDEEDEKELLATLLHSKLTPQDRVLTYLLRTKKSVKQIADQGMVTVGSEYLRKALNISVFAMVSIRHELVRQNQITVIETSPIRILFSQSLRAEPRTAGPTATPLQRPPNQ